MIDTLFPLISGYGAGALFAATFLSCLAVPVPTSLMMLAAGALVAAGDMVLWQVYSAALSGAIAGDQAGFRIGKFGGAPIVDRLSRRPSRKKLVDKARSAVETHGNHGVFLSRWLFSPLGPWVNFIAGSARLDWTRFTLWAALGEIVWVTVYVFLGYGFAANLTYIAELSSDIGGMLLSLGVAGAMVFWLRQVLRHRHEIRLRRLLPRRHRRNI